MKDANIGRFSLPWMRSKTVNERAQEKRIGAKGWMLKYLRANATWPLKEVTMSDTSVINVARCNGQENVRKCVNAK